MFSAKAREYAHHSVSSAYTSIFLKTALLLCAKTHIARSLLCGRFSGLDVAYTGEFEDGAQGGRGGGGETAAEDQEAEVGVARKVQRRPVGVWQVKIEPIA